MELSKGQPGNLYQNLYRLCLKKALLRIPCKEIIRDVYKGKTTIFLAGYLSEWKIQNNLNEQ